MATRAKRTKRAKQTIKKGAKRAARTSSSIAKRTKDAVQKVRDKARKAARRRNVKRTLAKTGAILKGVGAAAAAAGITAAAGLTAKEIATRRKKRKKR